MATSQRVAEIFIAAGDAFRKLGQMTMQLHPHPDTQPNSKWTGVELDALETALKTFGNDLNAIAEQMKHKTVSQVKQKIKDQILSPRNSEAKDKAGEDDSTQEPASKRAKPSLTPDSTPSTSQIRVEESLLKDDGGGGSDVDSVTIYSELQVDEDAGSSEEDGSDVDV